MHKMLKLYFEDYTNYGEREKDLQKNKKYVEYEKEFEEFKKELEAILIESNGRDKAFEMISQLDELTFMISYMREEKSFEYGFYTSYELMNHDD